MFGFTNGYVRTYILHKKYVVNLVQKWFTIRNAPVGLMKILQKSRACRNLHYLLHASFPTGFLHMHPDFRSINKAARISAVWRVFSTQWADIINQSIPFPILNLSQAQLTRSHALADWSPESDDTNTLFLYLVSFLSYIIRRQWQWLTNWEYNRPVMFFAEFFACSRKKWTKK